MKEKKKEKKKTKKKTIALSKAEREREAWINAWIDRFHAWWDTKLNRHIRFTQLGWSMEIFAIK